MPPAAFEILIVILLIVANGVFALAETAIVSARKARLQQQANQGDARARAALELANEPNDLLSTVQIGITLIGIFTGAFGGATIARGLDSALERVPALAPYSEAISLAVVVLGITYLSLVLGELVPKRIALNNPERIASAVAAPMRTVSRVVTPFVRLLSISTDLALRALGVKPSTEPPITEDEIRVLIRQGTQAGVFEVAEQEMLGRVLRLSDRRASTLMVPRREIVWLDIDDPPEEIRRTVADSHHSVYPVCRGDLDHVVGIVQAKDLLSRCLAGAPLGLGTMAQKPLYVPETIDVARLLELFRQTGMHAALVIDEYGGTQGLVTATDVLEAIVGELPEAGEPAEPQVVQREDGSWLIDGLLTIDEFKELFQIPRLPEEEDGSFDTVGGFVMTHLGRIPATGDHFEWRGLRFEVVDMDGHRVDRVLVAPISAGEPVNPA